MQKDDQIFILCTRIIFRSEVCKVYKANLYRAPTVYETPTLQLMNNFPILRILVLEGEMYQLSHMLTDQKSVLSAMMELSITGNKSKYCDYYYYIYIALAGCQLKTFKNFILMVKPLKPLFFSGKPLKTCILIKYECTKK